MNSKNTATEKYAVTRNACKLCTPLGACLAFKGVENAISLLHGSQGCSTYIRRYMISHYKEPVDIASSNFSEDAAIFGGDSNLKLSLDNVINQYSPSLVGIASTCLAETIGDDMDFLVKQYRSERSDRELPELITVSTPSYTGTHADGYHAAVRALVSQCAHKAVLSKAVNIFPGMVSAADLRYLKEILGDMELKYNLVPDYSETLDGGLWSEYHKIPEGGTTIESLRNTANSIASIECGAVINSRDSAAEFLKEKYSIKSVTTPLPIGVHLTDSFMESLTLETGCEVPEKYQAERNRLIDSYADAHKHIFDVTAALFGEEDLVISMASFLSEMGIVPVLCASGGKSGKLKDAVLDVVSPMHRERITVLQGVDFLEIEEAAAGIKPQLLIGNSKGYTMSRKMGIPLIRIGFPIHDRIGGQRILHIGYRGAQQLFDQITNTVIEMKQSKSPVGYTYM